MKIREKVIAGLALALPAAAAGVFMMTVAPQAADADCGTGCFLNGQYSSCGACVSSPPCGAGQYTSQQCNNGSFSCGCS